MKIVSNITGVVRLCSGGGFAILLLLGGLLCCPLHSCRTIGIRQAAPHAQSQPKDSSRRLTIVFGGDVMQHTPQAIAALRDTINGFGQSFIYLKSLFDTTDLVVLNLETTISPDQSYSGYPRFSTPKALASALKQAGADVLTIANNHICDKGATGISTTAATLDSLGIRYTGAFPDTASYRRNNPLYVEKNGFIIAFLNYTYGTNGLPVPDGMKVNFIDKQKIADDLKRIDRKHVDFVVVLFHWGVEYARNHNEEQRELAQWCHERGVEFVIGGHPHVLQPMETVMDSSGRVSGLTVYSLGNLVSNQRRRYCDGGALLRVEITQKDSLPMDIKAGYILAWVDTPIVDGRKEYHILPSYIADTMLRGRTSWADYQWFLSDSRFLLSSTGGIDEIRGRVDSTSRKGAVPQPAPVPFPTPIAPHEQ